MVMALTENMSITIDIFDKPWQNLGKFLLLVLTKSQLHTFNHNLVLISSTSFNLVLSSFNPL